MWQSRVEIFHHIRGGEYQQEMIEYTLLSICMVYEYDTILALPFPFPRKIETVHSDKKIGNTTVTLDSCLERESCPCSWV